MYQIHCVAPGSLWYTRYTLVHQVHHCAPGTPWCTRFTIIQGTHVPHVPLPHGTLCTPGITMAHQRAPCTSTSHRPRHQAPAPAPAGPAMTRLVYLTITCGAAASTARVAMIVNRVKVIRQSLSSTIAANFQSPSIDADSSSSRILSVITLISFKMRLSSRGTPVG